MGTPDFAVMSLKALYEEGHNIVGVVTMPDKPAGRGQKLSPSAVKVYAEEKGLKVLQPEKLKDETFIAQLRELNADLQVVVAFRMLPEIVWNMPKYGTVNVHASLLPQYRGAAPINWAIMYGDKKTGVTTFKLKHDIDTGDVMYQKSIDIEPNDNAGTIHDKLMYLGGELIIDTVRAIEEGKAPQLNQDEMSKGIELRPAPKIFKEDMKIDWSKSAIEIQNKIRGLSPYPAAWTDMIDSKGEPTTAKIFKTTISERQIPIGTVETDDKTYFLVGSTDKALQIDEIQLAGKKRMDIRSFLQGAKGYKIKA